MRTLIALVTVVVASLAFVAPARALDEEHYRQAREMIDKSIAYLRAQQDEETGGWSVMPEGRPQFPAISALVLNGMLMEPGIGRDDPAVAKGVDFILQYQQPDGGIYDRVLANYNTAISLSALARINDERSGEAIQRGQTFLKGIQWSEDAIDHPESGVVDNGHPYYGGVGYGGSGRPDLSNTSLMLQGLRDSGLDCDDESFQRALVFLERLQMDEDINDMPYAEGSDQGGFIYATSPNKDNIGVGESKAGTIEETLTDGSTGSRLRAYGSITYAGFKSYVFADLDRDDPRVEAAYDWIRRNYTLEENPGIGYDGFYYYLVTFSRAMDAWGLPSIQTVNDDGSTAESRDWANDLIDRLAELQNEDGSFRVVDDRWMEDNEVLITSYALLALQHAIN
jgi:squalene-hopene/tetraprenyl-beta-curcumene cyclase